ncbi:NAD(P)-binding domain-containing protein [Frondihabitans peucedani]|uniref:NAD(P)-binding domain-containing protein n=1 Tax=Frondihabitans peucedani TaxID=598626 RepID=A0ABP8E1D0_9MICO
MAVESIGIIGTGIVGRAVAAKALRHGYSTTVANSRGPEAVRAALGDIGGLVHAGDVSGAAVADVVFLAIPFQLVPRLTDEADWSNRVVVDTTNQFEASDPYRGRAHIGDLTGSEWVADKLPGARIVKALNTMFGPYIDADPQHSEGRQVAFFAGDDDAANTQVASILTTFGFAALPVGNLREGGRLMQLDGFLNAKHMLLQNALDAPVD